MSGSKGKAMEIWMLIGFLAAWFVLITYVLPRFGVST